MQTSLPLNTTTLVLPTAAELFTPCITGNKFFELSNHLGNVLVTISDRKVPITSTVNTTQIAYFEAAIETANDYYPFGMTMPSRSYSAQSTYRYGFNGKENDNSTGESNLDFGARIYDGRIGRWLSVDPLMKKYPNYSPYIFCGNNPVAYIDYDGRDFGKKNDGRTFDGPSTPTNVHQLGATWQTGLNYNINIQTGKASFTVLYKQQYSSNFTGDMGDNGGGSLERNNSGLFKEVEAHENGHADQFLEGAKRDISLTYGTETVSVNRGKGKMKRTENVTRPKIWTGRADVVLENIMKNFNEALNKDIETLKTNGILNTQEEIDRYKTNKQNEFQSGELIALTRDASKKVQNNIDKRMDRVLRSSSGSPILKDRKVQIDNSKAAAIEIDANNKSAASLGKPLSNLKYNSGKNPIKSNTGSGATLSY